MPQLLVIHELSIPGRCWGKFFSTVLQVEEEEEQGGFGRWEEVSTAQPPGAVPVPRYSLLLPVPSSPGADQSARVPELRTVRPQPAKGKDTREGQRHKERGKKDTPIP